MNPESFEKKLYIPRDVEGNPNKEDLAFLHFLQERLSKKKGFVGIALFGSVVSGYSIEESDIDIYMLYDDPEGFGGKIVLDLRKNIQDAMKEQSRTFHLLCHNINFDFLMHYIETDVESPQLVTELGVMSRLVLGKKIDAYRERFVAEIQKLSSEQRDILRNAIIENLANKDDLSLRKRVERLPDLSGSEHQDILQRRKEMWEKRVRNILNL